MKLRNAHAVLFHPSEEGSAEVVKRWKVDENNVPSWGEIVFFLTLRFSLLISLWIWWDLHVLRIFWAFSFFYAFFFRTSESFYLWRSCPRSQNTPSPCQLPQKRLREKIIAFALFKMFFHHEKRWKSFELRRTPSFSAKLGNSQQNV